MTRPLRWINRSGKTTAGGRLLLRGGIASPTTDAIDGQGFFGSVQFQFGSHPLAQSRGMREDDGANGVVVPLPGNRGVIERRPLFQRLGLDHLVVLSPADRFSEVDVAEVGFGG